MTKTYLSAAELAGAFPTAIRQDALVACATFPAVRALGEKFSVRVGTELATIPYRVHFDPIIVNIDSLTSLQRELVDCLLTRHTDGFVRQRHLARIIGLSQRWIPPFVVQLAGEYVIEILNLISDGLPSLDRSLYGEFLRCNPAFLDLTGRRIMSYWDCYYRNVRREEYVGFKILEFFRSLQHSA
jgi:PAS domain-containing protein